MLKALLERSVELITLKSVIGQVFRLSESGMHVRVVALKAAELQGLNPIGHPLRGCEVILVVSGLVICMKFFSALFPQTRYPFRLA